MIFLENQDYQCFQNVYICALNYKLKRMKRIVWLLIAVISLGVVGCATTGGVSTPKETAEMVFNNRDYAKALKMVEAEINRYEDADQKVPVNLYALAGNAAFALGDIQKAIVQYELAQYYNYVDELMYDNMLKHFVEIDNLSKEITALEAYTQNKPDGPKVEERNLQLLYKYVESKNWELGKNLWTKVSHLEEGNPKLTEAFLIINKELEDKATADQLAAKLLKIDAKNAIALEWLAYKYYWKAENRYQAEMAAYEKKKTRTTYAKLIKALDAVTVDFRKSLNYYQRLYKIVPDKKHARLLGNIYARMNDKEKSQFWKARAK